MKRVLALFLALLFLSGCAPREDIALTYAGKDIECEIAYAWDDMNIRGVFGLHRKEYGEDIDFTFIEPHTLRGVRVERVRGEISARLDSMELAGDEFTGWLGVEALFESEGEILESTLVELGGERFNKIVFSTDSPQKKLEIFLSGESGEPVMICGEVNGRRVEGRVISFSAK